MGDDYVEVSVLLREREAPAVRVSKERSMPDWIPEYTVDGTG
jgi:hypothetical protein